MKQIFLPLLLLCALFGKAQTVYYVSSTGGDDTNSGLSGSLPWKTLARVNSAMSSFVAGDSILFKCGDEFRGDLTITKSGSASGRITFGSYDTGSKPVINSSVKLNNWHNEGGNVWSAAYPGTLTSFNNFYINNTPQQVGRFPNTDAANGGYLTIDSFADSLQLTDAALSGYNFTGGNAVVKVRIFILNEPYIQSHTGSTLTFTPIGTNYRMANGYGYFIQNHRNTLDKQGEWYFSADSNKFYLYSTTNPDTFTTEAPSKSNSVTASTVNYINIKNICFRNSNQYGIRSENSSNITLSDCLFKNLHNAVFFNVVQQVSVSNNTITNISNNGISITGSNYTCTNNQLSNIGLRAGMGEPNNNQYNAINFVGSDASCEGNRMDQLGFCGIRFEGSRLTLKNNVISNFALTKSDAGGIYSFKGFAPASYGYGNNIISGNIISNGKPNLYGTLSIPVNTNYAVGIYLDNDTRNNTVSGNTVYNCNSAALLLNVKTSGHVVRNNTFYDNLFGFSYFPTTTASKNFTIKNNIFFSRSAYQVLGQMQADNLAMLKNMGSLDSNYYSQPFDPDSGMFQTNENYSTRIHKGYTLDSWRQQFQYDLHSTRVNYFVPPYDSVSSGSNLVTNATFSSGISSWTKTPASGSLSPVWDNTGVLDGGALKLNISGVSVPSTSRAAINLGNLQFGKFYQLKFSLKGSTDTAMLKVLLYGGYPVAKYKTVKTSTLRKEVIMSFSPLASVSNVSLMFTLNDLNNQVWLDNIDLRELTTNNTDPDDYLVFALNDEATSQTLSLPSGNYKDVKGISFSGSISLAPYSSLILMKQDASYRLSAVSKQTGGYALSDDANYGGLKDVLFPNPVTGDAKLKYHSSVAGELKLCIYNTAGEFLSEQKVRALEGQQELLVKTRDLRPGIYLLKMKHADSTKSILFIKE